MPDSVCSVRDLVVAAIRASQLTPILDVVAIYDPEFDLEGLKGGRIIVMPSDLDPKLLSRGGAQEKTCKINMAVQYKYAKPSQAELDPYMNLAESFSNYFLGHKFVVNDPTPRTVGGCLKTNFPHGLWVAEHIEKFKVFTSVITLEVTYTK